jgi:cysteine desulfurase family protein
MIYLDNAATSFPKPEAVVEAVRAALLAPASPGRSGHRPALEASRTVFRARKMIARLFGLPSPERVAFAPNITWAVNTALSGLGFKAGDEIITTSFEHNSTARPVKRLADERGVVWKRAPGGPDGLTKAADIAALIGPKTRLLVLNHASNVTGALLPLAEVRAAAGEVPILLDAAQTAGSVPLEGLAGLADIICFTGHKGLLGPTGTGGLWVRDGIGLKPLAVGGSGSNSEKLTHPDFMPDALEAGTLNTHGLAGLAAGVGWLLERGVESVRAREMALCDLFLSEIAPIAGLRVLGPGPGSPSRVACVSVVLDGWSSSDLAAALEARCGIMVRAGLHCAPLAHEAMGSFPGGAARFSFGAFSAEADARAAAGALMTLSRERRGKSGAGAL